MVSPSFSNAFPQVKPGSTAEMCLLPSIVSLKETRSAATAHSTQSLNPVPSSILGLGEATYEHSPTPVPPDLTAQESCTIISFYLRQLKSICGPNAANRRLSRPDEISNTANILLRRFYLSNSILSFDPLKILVAAIFLASKVEDRKISSRVLSEHVASLNKEVSVEEIISHELVLMEGVSFQLHQTHPFRGLIGFVDDLRQFSSKKDWYPRSASDRGFMKLHEMATLRLDDCTFSDMCLVYSPGKLIIVSVWMALLDLKSGLGYEGEGEKTDMNVEDEEDVEEDENGNVVNERDWSKLSIEDYIVERFAELKKFDDVQTSALIKDAKEALKYVKVLRTDRTLNCCNLAEDCVDMKEVKAANKKCKKERVWGKEKEKVVGGEEIKKEKKEEEGEEEPPTGAKRKASEIEVIKLDP
ncbi:hypothetical protein TrLO_g7614 [Triparma laevis f. longispina]|uniref:Cyclin-like domain-containing protein n=1 Tax=Triparma laevis f. longispina TaxID=1714387 RepID=A0A9W7E6X4_9STRA|nr:hypothetical protein TrLO_g7614 [Triparma laevis f. longispina]